jgi:hypothetical protein
MSYLLRGEDNLETKRRWGAAELPHAMKTYGVVARLHAFLTSAVDGGEWSASCPGSFIPREITPFPISNLHKL